jgi:formate-dependent nitrite reductase membrane component NrfD
LIWLSGASKSAATQESLNNLLFGREALFWWMGFVVCGLLLPLTLELLFIKGSKHSVQTRLAIAAILILIGAFSLRYGFVEVGTQGNLIDGFTNSEEHTVELRGEMTIYD